MMLMFEVFMFILGMFLQRKHLLMSLLMLELCVVCILSDVLIMFSSSVSTAGSLGLSFLGISVCDCLVGLGLLISRSKSAGGDNLNSLFSTG